MFLLQLFSKTLFSCRTSPVEYLLRHYNFRINNDADKRGKNYIVRHRKMSPCPHLHSAAQRASRYLCSKFVHQSAFARAMFGQIFTKDRSTQSPQTLGNPTGLVTSAREAGDFKCIELRLSGKGDALVSGRKNGQCF